MYVDVVGRGRQCQLKVEQDQPRQPPHEHAGAVLQQTVDPVGDWSNSTKLELDFANLGIERLRCLKTLNSPPLCPEIESIIITPEHFLDPIPPTNGTLLC